MVIFYYYCFAHLIFLDHLLLGLFVSLDRLLFCGSFESFAFCESFVSFSFCGSFVSFAFRESVGSFAFWGPF